MSGDVAGAAASALPLSGLQVIDASSFVSGPYAAMMLADLGADVIKVEPPGGDAYRRFGRLESGASILFANVNRNKRSAVIDLKSDDGQSQMLTLLGDADALLTNWRPGVAEALGLTRDVLKEINSGLVWCRVSGFGPDGPLAAAPAFDTVVQARSGLMVVQGGGGPPEAVRAYLADKVVAVFAAQAVLAALVKRGGAGEGAVLDVSMLDALSYFNGPDLLSERTLIADDFRPAVSEQLTALGCVPTEDGWVTLNPVRGRHVKGMAAAAGHPEWVDQLRLIDDAAARTRRIYELMASVTPSAPTSVWLQRFAEHDVPAGPVMDIDAHLADEQVEYNGTYVIYEHPQLGRIRQPRYPVRWGDGPPPDPTAAPALSEPAAAAPVV